MLERRALELADARLGSGQRHCRKKRAESRHNHPGTAKMEPEPMDEDAFEAKLRMVVGSVEGWSGHEKV